MYKSAVAVVAVVALVACVPASTIAQTPPAPTPDTKASFANIKKADQTVSDIYASQDGFGGAVIAVRGKVVKFSQQIMGKNWIHLQDGTGSAGTNDLTITTANSASVGDVVLVRGKVTLNKDFGAGYKYDRVIEDGNVQVEGQAQ
jgi:hypothetical protein